MRTFKSVVLFFFLGILSCSDQPETKEVIINWEEGESFGIVGTPFWGDVQMREARLWCQLEDADLDSYRLTVWNDSIEPATFKPILSGLANCVHFLANGLQPGTSYLATVDDGAYPVSDTLKFTTQTLWQYRTDPPALKLALGSCTFINEPEFDRPGDGYGGDYHIFQTMAKEEPDATFWLGDNVYLREVDFSSIHGFVHRYEHTRSNKELQELLAVGSHYAIWDDHDFGPNDCDGSWIHQDWSRRVFDAFWANPESVIPNAPELNVTTFELADVQVFLLDNRTHRVNHEMGSAQRQILGPIQRKWLLNALKNSRARFKLIAIGGQMVSDAAIFENFAQFPEERKLLLSELNRLDIRGVIFLTGDRHNSELSRVQLKNGNWVYDLTVSPLTSSSYDHTDEPNSLRVPGTMVGNRNYGIIEVSGPRKERVLTMTVKNADGEVHWSGRIDAADDYSLSMDSVYQSSSNK